MSSENIDPTAQKLADEREQQLKDIGAEPVVDDAEESTEEATADKKAPKEADESKKSDESEEDESDEADDTKDSKKDDKSDEDDKEDDADDDDSDDDADDDSQHVSPSDLKALKRGFKDRIGELETELATYKDPSKRQEARSEAKADIEKLIAEEATKLGVKPEVLKALVNITTTALGDKLGKIDEVSSHLEKTREKEAWQQDQEVFNSEWTKTESRFKEMYPNATPEQISAAKAKMDELAHSRKYHRYEMDYILFKEKAFFDKTLFSPKKKTFESASTAPNASEEFDEGDVDFSKLSDNPPTPGELERMEKRRNAAIDDSPQEKLTLHTTDESGRRVTRKV